MKNSYPLKKPNNMKKTIPFVIIGVVLIVVGIVLAKRPQTTATATSTSSPSSEITSNTSVADGKQLVEIKVKGGYSPRATIAKANTPTTVRFITNGSFDCSTAVTIPAIKYDANLPMTGSTDMEIAAQAPNTTLQGYCAMGMYSFTIHFE